MNSIGICSSLEGDHKTDESWDDRQHELDQGSRRNMNNLLEQAINCDDGGAAARIIIDALGIETDELANYCLKDWPTDRKQRALVIGNWLQEEAVFLA
jgi:hypothetical protein